MVNANSYRNKVFLRIPGEHLAISEDILRNSYLSCGTLALMSPFRNRHRRLKSAPTLEYSILQMVLEQLTTVYREGTQQSIRHEPVQSNPRYIRTQGRDPEYLLVYGPTSTTLPEYGWIHGFPCRLCTPPDLTTIHRMKRMEMHHLSHTQIFNIEMYGYRATQLLSQPLV